MPLSSNFNGSKKPRNKPRKDAVLRDAVEMLPSARGFRQIPSRIPEDIQMQNEMGEELLSWVYVKERTSLDDFFFEKKLSPMRFFRTAEKNEYLAQCIDIALSRIASTLQDNLKNNHLYLINKERQYSIMSREEARLKREADKDTQVTKIFVEEKIGIPVFNRKDKE